MRTVDIYLTINNGFKWYRSEGKYFKGYILKDRNFLTGKEAADHLEHELADLKQIDKVLRKTNGIFLFILQKGSETLIVGDKTRSFPVFYSSDEKKISISDDPAALKNDSSVIDTDFVKVFLHAGYVTGGNTLFGNIKQAQAGEYIRITSDAFLKKTYYRYSNDLLERNESALENELCAIINDIGDDLALSLRGKTPVIPLSSGFDSRLIAVLLKKRGFNDVVTFTYGRKNNPELELSEKTANKLGFKWDYIQYTDETVKGFLRSDEFNNYYPRASNYSSMFYLQEYFALEELQKKIPVNSVFIPGHSGDFFAGSHLNKNVISAVTEDDIIEEILKKHFSNKSIEVEDIPILKDSIRMALDKKENYSWLDFEDWDLKERQAKFILNSNRIYEYYGFEYRLPLMDSRLMDFFTKVHPDLKYGKKLYDKVLREKFFYEFDLNFDNETNPSLSVLEIQDKKNKIKIFLPKKIINFYREKFKKKYDIYYNVGVTDEMTSDLKASNVRIDMSGENRNSVIIQWYIDQILKRKIK